MAVKINDLTLPKEKLETDYQVVQVSHWQKDGEILGWTYECILPKLRFEKISVKAKSPSSPKKHWMNKVRQRFDSINLLLRRGGG
ncbi:MULTISPECIES: hypothetical protein [unclassified Enterococcus]|uniref:hypothetical protein n=1 Tax=unclassified Enterococcus TaxID=2608891 RepID=UPI0021594539|nr:MULTISPECIES: hypothetical protein [unclassified Enterococcus]